MKPFLLLLFISLSFCPPLQAEDVKTMTIPEFVAQQKKWSDWVGIPLRLEGRYSSFARTALRFQKCSLTFHLPSGTARPLSRSKTVEVSGEIFGTINDLAFRVQSFQVLPEDLSRFEIKLSALPKNDAVPWYQLGQQAIQRADFYDDWKLRSFGNQTLERGLEIERSRRKIVDAKFLRALANKASSMGMEDRPRLGLLHEAFQWDWKSIRGVANSSAESLQQQVQQTLPGSLDPLKSIDEQQFQQYQKDPINIYNKAADPFRKQLARFFYIQLVRNDLEKKMSPVGANADQLAQQYLSLVPEDQATADKLRQRALGFRMQNLQVANRIEILSLADEYRKNNQEAMAQTAMKTWLEHRRKSLSLAGASDYLQTALDYDTWINDRQTAAEILKLGIRKYPDDRAMTLQLQRWGFRLEQGQWINRDEAPGPAPGSVQEAIQAGRIIPGMSRNQVAAALGAPKMMTRIASANDLMIIWNYPDAKLSVRFHQPATGADPVVAEVTGL